MTYKIKNPKKYHFSKTEEQAYKLGYVDGQLNLVDKETKELNKKLEKFKK